MAESDLKEIHCRSVHPRSVENLRLFDEVISRIYRRKHSLDRQKGSQVGRIGRDEDEGEEPPTTSGQTPRHRPEMNDRIKNNECMNEQKRYKLIN